VTFLHTTGRGRGIYVTRDPLSSAERAGAGSFVCQDYIRNPLCVNGHKLDMRLFVLVTMQDGGGGGGGGCCCYLHRTGYVRFAAKPFSLEAGIAAWNADGNKCEGFDPFVHLTYINSHNKKAHRLQRAKEWTVQSFLDHLRQHPRYGPSKIDSFWDAVRQLVLRTVSCLPLPKFSTLPSCSHPQQTNVSLPDPPTKFELFGFDVLPDEDLRPWLLEVSRVVSPIPEPRLFFHA
jgi:hypothetical protein